MITITIDDEKPKKPTPHRKQDLSKPYLRRYDRDRSGPTIKAPWHVGKNQTRDVSDGEFDRLIDDLNAPDHSD